MTVFKLYGELYVLVKHATVRPWCFRLQFRCDPGCERVIRSG